MKKLLVVLMLFSTSAFAGGKLTLESRTDEHGNTRPVVGLSVYQSLMKNVAVDTWAGYGVKAIDDDPDVQWVTAKADVLVKNVKVKYLGGVSFGPGYESRWDLTGHVQHEVFTFKVQKELW